MLAQWANLIFHMYNAMSSSDEEEEHGWSGRGKGSKNEHRVPCAWFNCYLWETVQTMRCGGRSDGQPASSGTLLGAVGTCQYPAARSLWPCHTLAEYVNETLKIPNFTIFFTIYIYILTTSTRRANHRKKCKNLAFTYCDVIR